MTMRNLSICFVFLLIGSLASAVPGNVRSTRNLQAESSSTTTTTTTTTTSVPAAKLLSASVPLDNQMIPITLKAVEIAPLVYEFESSIDNAFSFIVAANPTGAAKVTALTQTSKIVPATVQPIETAYAVFLQNIDALVPLNNGISIASGEQTVVFTEIPTTAAATIDAATDVTAAAITPNGRRLQTVETRQIVPATYFQNGSFQPLYTGSSFPISVETERNYGTTLTVTLRAINTMRYQITYNNADGWVSSVQTLSETRMTGPADQMATESKVKNIIANTQQIAFENDGRIQFITDNGSTRISFDSSHRRLSAVDAVESRKLAAVETRQVVPSTYFQNGSFQTLYSGPSFPISVNTDRAYPGFIRVTLRGINTFNYDITYNNADGWVSNVLPVGQPSNYGTRDQLATESRVRNIIANAQQIAFENDGRIQFITDNGSTRISFDPSYRRLSAVESRKLAAVETRQIVPSTYFQNGSFQPLYTGSSFPISVETERNYGTTLTVTLRAINTMRYQITYNNADGWVSSVQTLSETRMGGPADQMATESKVKNIIANTQQVAFENDGRIQFITDNGSTRISFDFSHRRLSAVDAVESRKLAAVETRQVVPSTYFQNGSFQTLYSGPSFPISVNTDRAYPGFIRVTLRGINTFNYDITYNNADGWVSNVLPVGQPSNYGTPDQLATEARVRNIIANTQQIAFENDGRIQFITDNGSTRISFDPSYRRLSAVDSRKLAAVETRQVVPATYFQNGSFQTLYSGPQFPISVNTDRAYPGFIRVTLRGINSFNYDITYNNADGWVSNVLPVGQPSNYGTPDQLATEARVRNIVANTQQIAFENDGRIQFITDNGSTRITFAF